MTPPLWEGVAVALVTLFDPHTGEVDTKATAALAADLVTAGVRAVVVAGSTGEADALTDAERAALVGKVKDAIPGVPVLAGSSGPWAGPAADRTCAVVAAGADAVLVAPPRRAGDLVAYYAAIADAAGGAPVLAYHYPGVAGGDVPVDALHALPVAGMKDSSGSAERLLAELDAWDRWTYVGAAPLVAYAGALGATGAILAVANAAPEDAVAAWSGDVAAQRRLYTAHKSATARFPYGLKELVAARFGTSVASRLG